MAIAKVTISYVILENFLKGNFNEIKVESNCPDDAKIIKIHDTGYEICAFVESEKFKKVSYGEQHPDMKVTFTKKQ